MGTARQLLTFLALAATLGPGLRIDHALEHELEAVLGDAPRFDTNHEAPISEEHMESTQRSGDDRCYACPSRQTSPSDIWLTVTRHRLPRVAGHTSGGVRRAPVRPELGPWLGRAPPA